MMQVSKAVINGAKLAYPNGVKLKYENVSLTLSVGDGANTNTAPQGKICKIIVIIGNISNLIFFIVSTPEKISIFIFNYKIFICHLQWVHNSEKGVFFSLKIHLTLSAISHYKYSRKWLFFQSKSVHRCLISQYSVGK